MSGCTLVIRRSSALAFFESEMTTENAATIASDRLPIMPAVMRSPCSHFLSLPGVWSDVFSPSSLLARPHFLRVAQRVDVAEHRRQRRQLRRVEKVGVEVVVAVGRAVDRVLWLRRRVG